VLGTLALGCGGFIKSLKGKIILLHTMKAYRGTRVIAPLIFNLGTERN
jgi:hypothetical protein